MKSGWSGGRGLAFCATAFGILAAAGSAAHAEDEKAAAGASVSAGTGGAEASASGAADDKGEHGDKADSAEHAEHSEQEGIEGPELHQLDETGRGEHGTFYAWADFVFGFGKENIAVQNPPMSGPNAGLPPNYTTGPSQVSTQSLMLGLGFHATENIHLNLKMPIVWGEFNPPASYGITSRGVATVGNLEVEGEWTKALSESMRYFAILGISLPTAGGTEETNTAPNAVGAAAPAMVACTETAVPPGAVDGSTAQPNTFALLLSGTMRSSPPAPMPTPAMAVDSRRSGRSSSSV